MHATKCAAFAANLIEVAAALLLVDVCVVALVWGDNRRSPILFPRIHLLIDVYPVVGAAAS